MAHQITPLTTSPLKLSSHRATCSTLVVSHSPELRHGLRSTPTIRVKRPRVLSMENSTGMNKKKSLGFSSATIFVFPLDYGGSAVPEVAGPPIGLAAHHTDSSTVDISNAKRSIRSGVHRFSHLERVRMLKAANYTGRDIATFCSEATDIRSSREETQEQWYRTNKENQRAA